MTAELFAQISHELIICGRDEALRRVQHSPRPPSCDTSRLWAYLSTSTVDSKLDTSTTCNLAVLHGKGLGCVRCRCGRGRKGCQAGVDHTVCPGSSVRHWSRLYQHYCLVVAIFILLPGHGHTVNYLDRTRVSKYIALEPNVLMHPHIRGAAHKAGYNESDGTLLILACGAEDTASISSSVHGPIDTLISVLTLCTIPSPEASLTSLVRDVMGPGGQVLFYEHVESPRKDVAWWQKFWTPVWTVAFDGCRLDRPTHLWIGSIKDEEGEGIWAERRVWGKEGESEENLFWHQVGRFVKR